MAYVLSRKGPENPDTKALIKRIVPYVAPYRLFVYISLFAMLIVACAQGALVALLRPLIDGILMAKDREMLTVVPFWFLGITFASAFGRVIQNYCMTYCGLKVLQKLRDELYSKISYLPMSFFEGNQTGMLMSRVITDVATVQACLPALVMLIRQLFTMSALIYVAYSQDATWTFLALFVLPITVFPFVYFGKRLRKLGRKSQIKLADISIFLQEILSGIRVVKAFSTEKYEGQRFCKENQRIVGISLKQSIAGEFSSSSMEIIGGIGIALVLWYGGLQVIDGAKTAGQLTTFIVALAALYDPVKRLNSANNDIQKALAGAERVFEILDSPDILVEEDGDVVLGAGFTELAFKNVHFSYSEKHAPALNDISFIVKAGERVAIVGPSGAGKTTFVNLISRFYEPQQGEVCINGKNIQDYTLVSLRRSIAMVSQESFLFNISVQANIAYGSSIVTKENTPTPRVVIDAATSAYAHDFIQALPQGYETVIGERGAKLSGGQKQRLTIARAILKDAPLLILDEATSALDSESEGIVQKALENLMQNRTSIVIAHRLSTVLGADRIIVMDKGKIVAEGPHALLLETCPLYATLYNIQFSQHAV